jgi:hypothetical protein
VEVSWLYGQNKDAIFGEKTKIKKKILFSLEQKEMIITIF